MGGVKHRGRAGVILAVGVALSLVIVAGTAVAAVYSRGTLTESGAAMLSTALGTAIGALATYLGGNRATDELPHDGPAGRHRPEQLAPELATELPELYREDRDG